MMQTLNKMKEKLEKESNEHKNVKQQVAELTTRLHELSIVCSYVISNVPLNSDLLCNTRNDFFHKAFLTLPCVCILPPAETGSSRSSRGSTSAPRPPRQPSASSTGPIVWRHVPSSPASSWWCDASSTSASTSAWWSSASPWTRTHRGHPSATRSPPGTIFEEEEHSSAVQSSQVFQLVQVG